MTETIVRVVDVTKKFVRRGSFFVAKTETKAVAGVSFSIAAGETLGLVGESGCGKSTLAQMIVRLYEPDNGRIYFGETDITKLSGKSLKSFRKQMQMIFQDPFSALDAALSVEKVLSEPFEIHNIGTRAERRKEIVRLLERVGLSAADMFRYPHEFSGGQQQRIGIARALALRPKFIICDEAVSALDVSVQAQILNLLRDLQDEFNLSYLFISHNIAVTAFMSRRIGVMYRGKIVEIGASEEITKHPHHPYTKNLLAAIPEPDPSKKASEEYFSEELDENYENQTGCAYNKRCPIAEEICRKEEPRLREVEANRRVACHLTSHS